LFSVSHLGKSHLRERIRQLTQGYIERHHQSEAGQRALVIATRLAQALAAVLETSRIEPAANPIGPAGALAALARSDVLVLPRAHVDPVALAMLRCPVLLVG